MPNLLTAETLTDADIKSLAKQARREHDALTVSICGWALAGHPEHRATVAAMLNAERSAPTISERDLIGELG